LDLIDPPISTPDSWSGSIDILPESSIYADEGHEGWSVLDTVGLGNDYVNLQFYPLTGPILTEATTLDGSGNLHSYGESNSVLDGELDLDAVAVSLIGTATGTPTSAIANILGDRCILNSDTIGFGDDEYFNFSYDIIDARLGAELSLSQDFTFDPNLTVTLEANTGQTLEGLIGDTFTFDAPENGQNIEFVTTYSLNSSTLTNTSGLTGMADINLTVGQLDAEWNHWVLGGAGQIDFEPFYENSWGLGNEGFNLDIFSNSFSMAEGAFPTYIDGWVYDYSSSDQIAMNDINEGWYTDILWGEQFDGVGSWNVDGTAYVLDNSLHLETHSPTYAYTDFIIPSNAQTLTFDYYAQDTIAADQLFLWWNDDILFSLMGDAFDSDWMRTGFIDISNYAGQSGLLTIGLLSPTGRESSFIIDNINFYSNNPSSEPVPEPATMLLFGTGLVGLVGNRIRREKKHRACTA
jgi:hypothetical protein